jgi:NitT/TauT family transport system permease protein
MTDAIRKEAVPTAEIEAQPAPRDTSGLRTALMSVLLVIILLLLWEGVKAFSRSVDYNLVLGSTKINLSLFNDTGLPHLGSILSSFVEPAQRNGQPLGLLLFSAAVITFVRALTGFVIGGLLGFLLAIIFTHSRLLQRGLLPYVVASQTVPVLAIAPMIVVWMSKANLPEMAVPIIAAYLTFFPVTIYTLRGLTSVAPTSLELMRSYAATPLQILWKLRLPNALPQIFTALKISATASIVGAVIGELPAGLPNGLGAAILNYNQYYTQAPPRLWATIVAAAIAGMLFFVAVALVERFVIRWSARVSN